MQGMSFSAFLFLIAASLSVAAEEAVQLKIIDYGIFNLGATHDIQDKNVVMSKRFYGGNAELVSKTSTIPMRLGVAFCLRYQLSGLPEGTMSTVKIVAKYPPQGIKDPTSGVVHYQDEYSTPVVFGAFLPTCYRFQKEAELVPGTWVREIWYEGRKLGEHTFSVVQSNEN